MFLSVIGKEIAVDTSVLQDSADLLVDCLGNAIQYILYKRMIYPRDHFQDVQKFGMGMVALRDPELQQYMLTILQSAHGHALKGTLDRLVLCIIRVSTRDVLERWQFRISPTDGSGSSQIRNTRTDGSHSSGSHGVNSASSALHGVHNEITQAMKQIGVSFLPPLEPGCSFKLLLYTAKSAGASGDWVHTHPHFVKDGPVDVTELREIKTPVYKIRTAVVYYNPA